MAAVRTHLLGVKLPFWLWRWLYRDVARLIEGVPVAHPAESTGVRADAAPWPVLARLTCGCFRTYTVAESPHSMQRAWCHDCREFGAVEAAVSVADLVRIFDAATGREAA